VKTLRIRFAAMLATAAVVPLLTYGAVSVYSLREGTRRTVTDGNLNVARQVGEQIAVTSRPICRSCRPSPPTSTTPA